MRRLALTAALVVLSTSAFAQSNEPMKGIEFGAGCLGPVTTFVAHLGACTIDGAMSRIWCPNGQIFDRTASEHEIIPSSHVVRALCGLGQVL